MSIVRVAVGSGLRLNRIVEAVCLDYPFLRDRYETKGR